MLFIEYVKRKYIECSSIIRKYESMVDAMEACSRDMNCEGINQPCFSKGKPIYSTCSYPPQVPPPLHPPPFSYDDRCETLAFYQKSKQILLDFIFI